MLEKKQCQLKVLLEKNSGNKLVLFSRKGDLVVYLLGHLVFSRQRFDYARALVACARHAECISNDTLVQRNHSRKTILRLVSRLASTLSMMMSLDFLKKKSKFAAPFFLEKM